MFHPSDLVNETSLFYFTPLTLGVIWMDCTTVSFASSKKKINGINNIPKGMLHEL